MKNINIENKICKKNGKLKKCGNFHTAKIVDAELDIIDCSFVDDYCVKIDTKNYTFITLTTENLETLINLICLSEEKYRKKTSR